MAPVYSSADHTGAAEAPPIYCRRSFFKLKNWGTSKTSVFRVVRIKWSIDIIRKELPVYRNERSNRRAFFILSMLL